MHTDGKPEIVITLTDLKENDDISNKEHEDMSSDEKEWSDSDDDNIAHTLIPRIHHDDSSNDESEEEEENQDVAVKKD